MLQSTTLRRLTLALLRLFGILDELFVVIGQVRKLARELAECVEVHEL